MNYLHWAAIDGFGEVAATLNVCHLVARTKKLESDGCVVGVRVECSSNKKDSGAIFFFLFNMTLM
jgi:hypothetical protein